MINTTTPPTVPNTSHQPLILSAVPHLFMARPLPLIVPINCTMNVHPSRPMLFKKKFFSGRLTAWILPTRQQPWDLGALFTAPPECGSGSGPSSDNDDECSREPLSALSSDAEGSITCSMHSSHSDVLCARSSHLNLHALHLADRVSSDPDLWSGSDCEDHDGPLSTRLATPLTACDPDWAPWHSKQASPKISPEIS